MTTLPASGPQPPIPDFALPPLPPIANAHLNRLAKTHSGAGTFGNRLFEGNGTKASIFADAKDYEKLEYLGDAIIHSLVKLLVQDLHPSLTPGESTALVSYLVRNDTIAELSRRYKLTDRLVAEESSVFHLRINPKVCADMFEAHVAGVYYDYLTTEVPGAFQSLSLPPPLPLVGNRTVGGTMDYVLIWLRPLFTPLVQPVLDWMNALEDMPVTKEDAIDDLAYSVNAVSILHMWAQQEISDDPIPKFELTGQEGPAHKMLFTMSCTVKTRVGKFTASATRSSKKAAKHVAAYHVAVLMDDAGVHGMQSIPRERPPLVFQPGYKGSADDENQDDGVARKRNDVSTSTQGEEPRR